KLINFGHRRAIQQHRHHGNAPGEGRANLDANKVFRIVKPSPPRLGVRISNPTRPDKRKYNLALFNLVFQYFDEVGTWRYRIDIYENLSVRQVPQEGVVQLARWPLAVFPAITDENFGRCRWPGRPRPRCAKRGNLLFKACYVLSRPT